MKGSVEIKKAEVADVFLLKALSIETFEVAYAAYNTVENMTVFITDNFNAVTLTKELQDPRNSFFFIHVDGVLAGYCKLRDAKRPDALGDARAIELERLYILQAFQKNKAGGALMRHCIDHATAMGYSVLWLGVWEHNVHARRFYDRWGYAEFGKHVFMLGNDVQIDKLMKRIL